MNHSKHPAINLTLVRGSIVVQNSSRRCTNCILPETFPGCEFGPDGICTFCQTGAPTIYAEEDLLLRVDQVLAEATGNRQYDCIALYSGGKDSSMALFTLVKEMGLRVLAFTLDNGFLSSGTPLNMRKITESLNIDHIIFRPQRNFMKTLYSLSLTEPFDVETTKYATSSCGSCISIVLATASLTAAEKGVPLLAGGWTPGQFTDDAFVDSRFLQEVCSRHFTPLKKLSAEITSGVSIFDNPDFVFPSLFNPLYCKKYSEDQLYNTLESLGWQRPKDTDSCSSNCRLNSFLVVDHLIKYGYHPYEYELAGHVRAGFMKRTNALEKVSQIHVSQIVLDQVARELGIEPLIIEPEEQAV